MMLLDSTQDTRHGLMRDNTGREIRPGDLLKTYHFTGARKKRYWLYHTVVVVWVKQNPYFRMVPTQQLEPTLIDSGGACALTPDLASNAEIIAGHGPGDCLGYEDRKRVKPTSKCQPTCHATDIVVGGNEHGFLQSKSDRCERTVAAECVGCTQEACRN